MAAKEIKMAKKNSACLFVACLIAWGVYTSPALAMNKKNIGSIITTTTSKGEREPAYRDKETEKWVEYIKTLEVYLSKNPDWKNEAWGIRAHAYKKIGNRNPLEAMRLYSKGIRASKDKKYKEAVSFYEQATTLDPVFPWSANNLAWALATCPEEEFRNGAKAVKYAKRAIENTGVPVADFYGTLAAAYAANSEFDNAVLACKKAIELYPDERRKEMLQQFMAKKPYINSSNPRQKEDAISLEGYGKAKWGMNKIEVWDLYPNAEIKNNDLLITYGETFFNRKAILRFYFFNDMLYRVKTSFTKKKMSTEYQQSLEKYLVDQYGKPNQIDNNPKQNNKFVWNTKETIIEYKFFEKSRLANIVYASRKLDAIVKERENAKENTEGYHDVNTDLVFPRVVAGMERIETTQFEEAALGTSIRYYSANGIRMNVFLYNYGHRTMQVKNDIYGAQQRGHYKSVVQEFDTSLEVGSKRDARRMLCASFKIEDDGIAYISRLYLTGCRNHFVKIRCSYPEKNRYVSENTVNTFMEKLATLLNNRN
jgi:tetratricopeptide (TPR) repeat protein